MTDHKNQFEICVRAIIRRGNKILVCIGKKSGIYFFPGGHIEYGETAEAALKRELKEVRREMKERGIKKTSCFNGGLTAEEHWFNSKLFELKTKLGC